VSIVTNLLALYAGLVLINAALSGALWLRSRDALHGTLVLVWASTLLSYLLQGVFYQNALVITYAFASAFLVNLALAALTAQSLGLELRWQRFVALLAGGAATSGALYAARAGFTAVALPVAAAVALPALTVAARAARRWRSLTVVTRGLLVSCVTFSLHNLDFPFLRHRPELAPLGFTIATLIVFALSITAPAVVLERLADRQARVDAEVQAARHIQTRLLPTAVRAPGLELASHMRSAESVGGDYLDLRPAPGGSWLFLGDVTGHGLGAGLVALMAQSTMTALIEARPALTPRELTFLANRVLAANLTRLGEQRHMTFVALRSGPDGTLTVSGSHEALFIHRAAAAAVEIVELAHFPLGLGFVGDLPVEAFGEDVLRLAPGDLLLVASDGVLEAARDGDHGRGMFGEEALAAFLHEHAGRALPDIKTSLMERLDEYTGGVYHDDVSFVLLRGAPSEASLALGTDPGGALATSA
jgi:serine phosphatase RsbU (regulator of sigma subunit)